MLIGLYSSVPRCGKSTLAQVAAQEMGFVRVSFAYPLKAMTRALLTCLPYDDITIDSMMAGGLKQTEIDEIGCTPRWLMQTLGTEWGRDVIDKNLWVKIAQARCIDLMDREKHVIIDDMRFPNEYQMIKELGGHTMKIDRPGFELPEGGPAHPSDGALSAYPFDTVIVNKDESVEAYKEACRFVMDRLIQGLPL